MPTATLSAAVQSTPVSRSVWLLAALVVGACSSTTGSSADEVPYAEQMSAICTATEADLAVLPDPPDEISLTDFATEVERILRAEADSARLVEPPDDLDADHRAFVANTDEQASGWERVAAAATSDPDSIGTERTHLAQLILGRDDLVFEMGLEECQRGR